MLVEPVVENADMLVVTVEGAGSLLESYIGTSKPSSSCEIFLCSCGASHCKFRVFHCYLFHPKQQFLLFSLVYDRHLLPFDLTYPTYLFFSRKRAASTYWTWVFTACVQWQDMKPILGRPPLHLSLIVSRSFFQHFTVSGEHLQLTCCAELKEPSMLLMLYVKPQSQYLVHLWVTSDCWKFSQQIIERKSPPRRKLSPP